MCGEAAQKEATASEADELIGILARYQPTGDEINERKQEDIRSSEYYAAGREQDSPVLGWTSESLSFLDVLLDASNDVDGHQPPTTPHLPSQAAIPLFGRVSSDQLQLHSHFSPLTPTHWRPPQLIMGDPLDPQHQTTSPMLPQKDTPLFSANAFDVDPSLFPDPYPSHSYISSLPALSSGSSNSARSSAYTSPGSALRHSGDSSHLNINVQVHHPDIVHDNEVGLGITADLLVDPIMATSVSSRAPVLSKSNSDISTRWSGHSSSSQQGVNTVVSTASPPPKNYDATWDAGERDESFVTTDDESDDDDKISNADDSFGRKRLQSTAQDRTAAAVIADEGLGTIVYGERTQVHQIPLVSGATHLLLSSSASPNSLPPFLMTTLPALSSTLLALDISANYLLSLPASLSTLSVLEELNVSSNPLRALPTFLSSLHRSLRVLIADSAGLSGLPIEMACMKRLNVLSIRRNKLHSVPDCICGMDALEDLRLDGNNFLGPWKALVEPLLQVYDSSHKSYISNTSSQLTATSSAFSVSDEESSGAQEEEHTIRAPLQHSSSDARILPRSFTAPINGNFNEEYVREQNRTLVRTRTIPSRSLYQRSPTPDSRLGQTQSQYQGSSSGYANGDQHAMRRMRSANELRDSHRRGASGTPSPYLRPNPSPMSSDSRTATPDLQLSLVGSPIDVSGHKFGSLKFGQNPGRLPHSHNIVGEEQRQGEPALAIGRASPRELTASQPYKRESSHSGAASQEGKGEAGVKGKWGFLKKMSMGRLKPPDTPSSSPAMKFRDRPTLSQFLSSQTVPRIGQVTEDVTRVPSIMDHSSPASSLSPSHVPPSFLAVVNDDASHASPSPSMSLTLPPSSTRSLSMRRRSFLPIDIPSIHSPPAIPSPAPALKTPASIDLDPKTSDLDVDSRALSDLESRDRPERERLVRAKRSLMAYLFDMFDLGMATSSIPFVHPNIPQPLSSQSPSPGVQPQEQRSPDRPDRMSRPTLSETGLARVMSDSSFSSTSSSAPGSYSTSPRNASRSTLSLRDPDSNSHLASLFTSDSDPAHGEPNPEERKGKGDKGKRVMIIREIVETERTYVKGLQELMDIYIKPAASFVTSLGSSSKETVIPISERKVVFSGLDALYHFHHENFLPALEFAASPVLDASQPITEVDVSGHLSSSIATAVANVFLSHAAFMKMYSSYINNFDSAIQRLRMWTTKVPSPNPNTTSSTVSPTGSVHLAGLGIAMTSVGGVSASDALGAPGIATLTTNQKKRIKSYLKRCRLHPRHSQLNLEGYLLLPVQRIPRYRLLLEQLVHATPPVSSDGREDALDRSLAEISSLAVNMNEGKRDSESRRKLVQWQSRIRGKFPSPLVQPHRRLIMDGPLHLTRVVRRNSVPFEVLNSDGDTAEVHVDCLTPEETPRDLVGILCNDLLVLCKDPSRGLNPTSLVDLWAVLRMQTLATPASVAHGSTLRLVDNKAILYFEAPSTSDALTWSRAINLHIPASKT